MTISFNRSLVAQPKPDYGKVVQQAIEHPFKKVTERSYQTAILNAGLEKAGLKPLEVLRFKGSKSEAINQPLVNYFKKVIAQGKLTLEKFEDYVKAGNMGNNSEATINAIRSEFTKKANVANLPAVVKNTTNLPAVIDKSAQKASKGFLGGLVDSLKSFAKTKKGKIGLAAAALATVIGGGIYLYNRNKDYNIPVSDSSPINDLANSPVNGKMTANGPYTVAKGDNIWCIARANLMEIHKDEENYKPTDVDILKRTEEIMQLNNLKYEDGCYRVKIQVNQTLKLAA